MRNLFLALLCAATLAAAQTSTVMVNADNEIVAPAAAAFRAANDIASNTDLTTVSNSVATVTADLATHEADETNPHAVTAAQVGSYTTAQADAAFQPLDADLTTLAGNDGSNLTGVDAATVSGIGPRSIYNYSQAQVEHLKTRLAAVQANTSQHITGLSIGDSLNGKVFPQLSETYLKKWFDVDPTEVLGVEWDESLNNIVSPAGGIGGAFSISGATISIKDDYDVEFIGTYYTLTSVIGDIQVSKSSGGTVICDRVLIPYVIEPGAGSFKIQLSTNSDAFGDGAHASWADPVSGDIASSHTLTGSELIVDADGAYGLGVVILEYDSTAYRLFQVLHESGGNVRFLRPAFFIETDDTVNWFAMGEGSNNFASSTDASIPLMAALIAAIEPDIITVQSDDTTNAYNAFCPRLASAIEQAALGYEPTIILVGEGPKESGGYNIPAVNNALAAQAGAYGWYFIDGLSLAKDWTTLDGLGWGGDGIHLGQEFYSEMAARIASELGLDAYPVTAVSAYPSSADIGRATREVNTWKSAVAANSGTLTDNSEGAALQLLIELNRTGLREKIKYMLPLFGADLNSMEVPLIDDTVAGNATPNALTDTDVDESYGFQKATGTDHYLDTHIVWNTLNGTNDSFGIYFTGRTSGYPFGVRQVAYDAVGWVGALGLHIISDLNIQKFTNAELYYDGLHILNRSTSTMTWYLDGELINSRGADATPELGTKTLKVGAHDEFDGSIFETNAKIGFFFWGTSLTSDEAALLDSIIQSVIVDVLGR